MSETLAEALPKEITRCQELLEIYKSLPNDAGTFGAVMIQQDIDTAIKAAAAHDTVAMIRALAALRDCQ